MHLTFHTSVRDETAHAALAEMADLHSRVERKMYAAIAAGKDSDLSFKTAFSEAHNLTSRQFNSMALEVKGKIAGVREALEDHVTVLEARSKMLKGAISDLKRMVKSRRDAKGRLLGKDKLERKKRSLHEKKRKLARLGHRIAALKVRIAANVPGICFGTRKLFMKQFDETVDMDAWRQEFRDARNSQFLLIGTASEETGCASCQARLEDDGTVTLRLRPFNAMLAQREPPGGQSEERMQRRKTVTAKASDFITIRGVTFGYGRSTINAALAGNASADKTDRTPLTWRFVRDNGRWFVHLSLDVPETAVFDATRGAVGVDFNEDHIAATVVDRHGNYLMCRRFDLNLYGLGSLQARDKIRCVARDVAAWTKTLCLSIVAEELDFKKKKQSMAALSAKRSRQLSSLHYSAWVQALSSRCLKDGVALKHVNPAYTSLIGRVKFASSLGLSVHHAAAMAIARRGLGSSSSGRRGLSERLPKVPVRIPDGVGGHVTLNPVVNTGHRHVWFFWAKAAKAVNAARVARLSAKASSAAGSRPKRKLDDTIPDFPWAGPVDQWSQNLGGMVNLEVSGESPERRPDHPVAGRLSSSSGFSAPMTEQTTPASQRNQLTGRFW